MNEPTETGEDLVSQGGRIPHGTPLRGNYHDQEFTAEVRDGKVILNDEEYSSLSAAAEAAKKQVGAEGWLDKVTANGWTFWKRQHPEEGEWYSCKWFRANYDDEA